MQGSLVLEEERMSRKKRLKQIMKEEAEAIGKAADRIDYEVMSLLR